MFKKQIIFVCLWSIAAASQATITCSAPKLATPIEHNSLYHFKATVTCDLTGENINLASLKDSFLGDITKKGTQFKVYKKSSYDNKKGLQGYELDVTQSYDTDNGAMAVHANIIIADDRSKNFYFELRSKSISAEGDAEYDKSILNITTLELLANNAKLTVIKEIDVQQPWYAPESMFFGRVEPELKDAINKSAMLTAKKICGQKVDALSK